jgi:hypothetical protein
MTERRLKMGCKVFGFKGFGGIFGFVVVPVVLWLLDKALSKEQGA